MGINEINIRKKLFSVYTFLSSGRILPLIILVAIPSVIIIGSGFLSFNISAYLLGFSFIVMIMLYAPYRAAYSTEEYFKRRGYENVIAEYFAIKYVLYGAIPVFIFFTVLSLMPEFERYFVAVLGPEVVFALRTITQYIVIAGLIKIVLQIARKEFRLYFAVGCIRFLARKEDEIDSMKYLIWGLNAYNLYLRRYLKLEINNLKKIYSIIGSAASTERNKFRDALEASFNFGKLEPLQPLLKYLSTEEKEQILVKESYRRKVKEGAAFLAIVIPIIISLFEFSGLLRS